MASINRDSFESIVGFGEVTVGKALWDSLYVTVGYKWDLTDKRIVEYEEGVKFEEELNDCFMKYQ